MPSANFLDINILIKTNPKAWIVNKSSPNIPIIKIDISDFNLFKSGILKSQGNNINFNGKSFWLSNDFMHKLKVKSKNNSIDISNLGISMQEFLNPEISKNLNFEINSEILNLLSNSKSDIYIICSKNKKNYFQNQIDELEKKISEMGLSIKHYYFTSESFNSRNNDHISYIKTKILIQHLIGIKAENDILIDEKIAHYNEISFWDDDKKSIQVSINSNSILEKLLSNSSDYIKKYVKEVIKNNSPILISKEYTHNKSNKFIQSSTQISYPNLVKSFENFRYK